MSGTGRSGGFGTTDDPRRGLFSSKRSASPSLGDPRLEAAISASHQAIAERFEESLRAVADSALASMRQVAEDMWRATGEEVKDLRARILHDLSREQAIRGLIAHSDERFQALDVRVARIEEGMGRVDEAARSLQDALGSGTMSDLWREGDAGPPPARGPGLDEVRDRLASMEAILQSQNQFAGRVREWLESAATAQTRFARELSHRVESAIAAQPGVREDGAAGPAGAAIGPELDEVRERLSGLQQYLSSVVQYLGDRDRTLIEWIQTLAKNQAAELASETDRILASLDERLDVNLERVDYTVRDAIALHAQSVHDQIEQQARLVTEGLGVVETKALARIEEQARQLEAVADQIRVESDDVKRLVIEQAGAVDLTHELDERLGRLVEIISSALGWTVDQLQERIQHETLRSVTVGHADLIAMLDRRFVDLDHSIGQRVETMDRAIRAGLGALEESLVERSAEAIDEAVNVRLIPAATDLGMAASGIRESAHAIEAIRESLETGIARALDDRVAALARMVRSDHEALADRLEVVEQQAAAKEAIRAVNELAAALPGEIGEALDKRLAVLAELLRRESRSTAEVVAKVGGALADRMDRSVAKIGDRFESEVETVVDQIGGTMANIATGLKRPAGTRNRAS